jgi:hypothetical protein
MYIQLHVRPNFSLEKEFGVDAGWDTQPEFDTVVKGNFELCYQKSHLNHSNLYPVTLLFKHQEEENS